MKKLKKCPLLVAIAVFGLVCTLLGAWGRTGIYRNYRGNWPAQPLLANVFLGISDKIYPWQLVTGDGGQTGDLTQLEAETEAQSELPLETETERLEPSTQLQGDSEREEEKTYTFTHVEEDYFNDAVFIGDSRIVGLHDYSGWDHTTYYASIGLTVYDVFDKPIVEENGMKITIEQALREHQFKKIYVMIGINEMGTGTVDTFMAKYEEMVHHLQELQPEAIIFLHEIMKVKQEKSETDPIFNNPAIQERNDRIAKLADNRTIFYLDVNEVVTDENGNLNADYTYDEIHLLGKWYVLWTDYLKEHGIVKKE